MLAKINIGTLRGRRDRALLLLGFAGAFRRSELTAIRIEDLEHVAQGLRVTLRRSKTNQIGATEVVPILRSSGDLCPVTAVDEWIRAAALAAGPLFRRISRTDRVLSAGLEGPAVSAIVKAHALAAGLAADDLGGHSLRAGMITAAIVGGKDALRVMDITRHKRVETLRGYIRRAEEFVDHPLEGLM